MQRLRTPAQFRRVLEGARVATTEHFALHRQTRLTDPDAGSQVSELWIGAVVPKRWARRAATRNLIRRQIYSQMHERRDRVMPAAYLVRLRAAFDRQLFVSAQSDALRKAVRTELAGLLACIDAVAAGRSAPALP